VFQYVAILHEAPYRVTGRRGFGLQISYRLGMIFTPPNQIQKLAECNTIKLLKN
jgi:hypothetical protein